MFIESLETLREVWF